MGHPSVAPVPEPASLMLMISGLAGIAGVARRKRSCWGDSYSIRKPPGGGLFYL